jgi:hypothetical protein
VGVIRRLSRTIADARTILLNCCNKKRKLASSIARYRGRARSFVGIFDGMRSFRRANASESGSRGLGSCGVCERAQRVDEAHLVDGAAAYVKEPRAGEDDAQRLGARDGDVEAVDAEQELDVAGKLVAVRPPLRGDSTRTLRPGLVRDTVRQIIPHSPVHRVRRAKGRPLSSTIRASALRLRQIIPHSPVVGAMHYARSPLDSSREFGHSPALYVRLPTDFSAAALRTRCLEHHISPPRPAPPPDGSIVRVIGALWARSAIRSSSARICGPGKARD